MRRTIARLCLPLSLAVVAAVAPSGAGATDDGAIVLRCSVPDEQGAEAYVFRIDPPRIPLPFFSSPTIRLVSVSPSLALNVVVFSTEKLEAELETALPNWPPGTERVTFEVNRNTGDFAVSFTGPRRRASGGIVWSLVTRSDRGRCARGAPVL